VCQKWFVTDLVLKIDRGRAGWGVPLDALVEKKGNSAHVRRGDGRVWSLGEFQKIQEVQWDTRRGFIGEVLGLNASLWAKRS
jgi:hypothetical protein